MITWQSASKIAKQIIQSQGLVPSKSNSKPVARAIIDKIDFPKEMSDRTSTGRIAAELYEQLLLKTTIQFVLDGIEFED